MLSAKQGGIKYDFWVFGMTQLGTEPWSPGPFANTRLIRPIGLAARMFVEGPESLGSTPGRHTKDSKNSTWCLVA